jgi:LPS-assembly lipoprotein
MTCFRYKSALYKSLFSGLLVCCSALFLNACGFSLLYGNHGETQRVTPQLSQIVVMNIPDAVGVQMRNAMLDRLPPPAANPRYQLSVTIAESKAATTIARDATVTRQQLRSTARAVLRDRQNGNTVWQQDIFTTSGYNVLGSQFSNLIGEEDARKRNVADLSERLTAMLALYFSKQSP